MVPACAGAESRFSFAAGVIRRRDHCLSVTPFFLRTLEHVHGHLGWLSAAALIHPALLLRRPRRRALTAATVATVLVTVTAIAGAAVYPAYRLQIKPALFATAPLVGLVFERKEHLGVAALVLAWSGLILHALNSRSALSDRHLHRAAFLAYAWAAAFALTAAVLGVVVAVHRSLPG
jgi:hypothetical protein